MANREIDLHTVPISVLTAEARNLLSCLLNSTKILLSDTSKRPRDWRGFASLIGIPTEVANSFETNDKTSKVLEYWVHRDNGNATIGQLLVYMQDVDRFDAFDDLMELLEDGTLFAQPSPTGCPNPCVQVVPYDSDEESNILTFDDKIHGSPQFYHAYVLFAPQDWEFVDEMLTRMKAEGLKLCTESDLLPDFDTPFTPVSRLISSDRCHRTVLVYSPDFLDSPANNFFMNYAQAVGIEKKRPKIVPVMYRECNLPKQLTFYHKLYYEQPGKRGYDFWGRLKFSLQLSHELRLNGAANGNTHSSLFSSLNITEVNCSYTQPTQSTMLALPRAPRSASECGLDRMDSRSQSSVNITKEGKKKSLYQKIISPLRRKKNKVPALSP